MSIVKIHNLMPEREEEKVTRKGGKRLKLQKHFPK